MSNQRKSKAEKEKRSPPGFFNVDVEMAWYADRRCEYDSQKWAHQKKRKQKKKDDANN